MPFISEKQRRYCYWLASKAKKRGEEPKWDCKKYGAKKAKRRSLKRKSGNNRRRSRRPTRRTYKHRRTKRK